jgi:hypothetical protein
MVDNKYSSAKSARERLCVQGVFREEQGYAYSVMYRCRRDSAEREDNDASEYVTTADNGQGAFLPHRSANLPT